MDRRGWKSTAAYVALLSAAFVLAVAGSWMFGAPVDNAVYDYMFQRLDPEPWQTASVVLAIDEPTLNHIPGGIQGLRGPLAKALNLVAAAHPQVVAVDVILAGPSQDPAVDGALAAAFCASPNLVLSAKLTDDRQHWEDPIPPFRACAAAVGHVHAQPDDSDSRTRSISLVRRIGHDQRWALSLEAFRLSRGAPIVESQAGVEVGHTLIPAPGLNGPHLMRVRFIPRNSSRMPPVLHVSMQELLDHPEVAIRFANKVVFVGATAATLLGDRLFTPASSTIPTSGIEIHAEAFETMAQSQFITDVSPVWVLLFSLLLACCAGMAFRYLPGWRAYAAAGFILLSTQVVPYVFFRHLLVFSVVTPASAALFATTAAAAYYHLVVRRDWLAEQSARTRYQQAMHFVTHEMRTPLSAIQGSSELISRYALTEEKRKQIADLINSESKRLARMVEIFLNVERLSAGQMELKREAISVRQIVDICGVRVAPLAGRKHIELVIEPTPEELQLTGDRELMEYACYNLLTNAVKYSPQRTRVTVTARQDGGHVRIAIQDQGIGMDHKEVKQIFQKFYRTRKAEESGEAGTGIGLSIVQQIVEQHGGTIEVISQPGAGSCFTLVLPAAARSPVPTAAERH